MAVSYKAQYPFDCLREDGNREKPESLWAPVSAGCGSPVVPPVIGAWGLGAGKLRGSIQRDGGGEDTPVAAVCIGRVKEYCPYKDWSTQMPPSLVVFPQINH